jgi:hypothetical protein
MRRKVKYGGNPERIHVSINTEDMYIKKWFHSISDVHGSKKPTFDIHTTYITVLSAFPVFPEQQTRFISISILPHLSVECSRAAYHSGGSCKSRLHTSNAQTSTLYPVGSQNYRPLRAWFNAKSNAPGRRSAARVWGLRAGVVGRVAKVRAELLAVGTRRPILGAPEVCIVHPAISINFVLVRDVTSVRNGARDGNSSEFGRTAPASILIFFFSTNTAAVLQRWFRNSPTPSHLSSK